MELRKTLIAASVAALCALSSCLAVRFPLQGGDLLFHVAGGDDFSDAIAAATGTVSLSYDHVGIYISTDSGGYVVEAVPRHGVTMTPLREFLDRAPTVAMRYVDEDVAAASPGLARRLIGHPYDWRFAPGADAVYCSELVQLAYLDRDSSAVFPSAPMNFLDADGQLPRFWVELYDSLGCEVPQGIPGTNPTAMARDPRLHTVWQSF